MRLGCPLWQFIFNIVLEVLSRELMRGKQTKKQSIQLGREEVKLSLYAMTWLYIENSKDSTQKLLPLINEFSKVAGSKIIIQKSVAMKYQERKVKDDPF